MYEAHIYFNHDNSGRYVGSYEVEKAYPTIGVDRLKPFVDWLREKNAKGFIGEFGVPANDPRWIEVRSRTPSSAAACSHAANAGMRSDAKYTQKSAATVSALCASTPVCSI